MQLMNFHLLPPHFQVNAPAVPLRFPQVFGAPHFFASSFSDFRGLVHELHFFCIGLTNWIVST
jgi:hypothetical protein